MRAAFAEDEEEVLSQEHLDLIDVFSSPHLFVYEDEDEEEVRPTQHKTLHG